MSSKQVPRTSAPTPRNEAARQARAEILGRVRSALRDVHETETPADTVVDRPAPVPVTPEHVDLFAERVADYEATVVQCTEAALAERIDAALEGRGVLVPAGFEENLTPKGALRDVTTVGGNFPLSPYDLDGVEAVLTTAKLGIAETGTIVLDHSAGQGRRVTTLIPDRHLCVVRTSQVVADVAAAVRELDPERPLTWISGPSATSDIELDRVEGVHGPRTLIVFLVSE
ncbi:lactate utilization protein C [Streptomyces sp. NPDC059142]|uniref:LutC/YkgG family protein n=1 Tax=Streptomyces sp. NPDC059142 TaxID=3346739 RepID=UPI003694030B